MTLPASFPLSMSQIASELGLSLPLSTSHSWVQQLAGGPPVSFSNLLGQSGKFTGTYTPGGNASTSFINPSAPFFRGTILSLSQQLIAGPAYNITLSSGANWNGNIKVTGLNGNVVTLINQGGGTWSLSGTSTQIMAVSQPTTFTFQPA